MRDRRRGGAHRRHRPGGDAPPQGSCARRRSPGRGRRGRSRRQGLGRGLARLVAHAVGGPRSRPAPRCRAARRPVANDDGRGDDAEPVEDRAPGRDRRRVRADRLLPLQRRVHDPRLRGAAGLLGRGLEPAGIPPARGVRLRGQPVQLHGDRREPDELACADGEHDPLEAGFDRGTLRVLHDEAVRGGGPAARGGQPRLRPWLGGRRPRAREPRPRRHPLHRLDGGLPEHVERRSGRTSSSTATTRGSSARRAARTSSSRTPPPTSTRSRPRSSVARSNTRARSAPRRRECTHRPTSGRSSASASSSRSPS